MSLTYCVRNEIRDMTQTRLRKNIKEKKVNFVIRSYSLFEYSPKVSLSNKKTDVFIRIRIFIGIKMINVVPGIFISHLVCFLSFLLPVKFRTVKKS